MEAFRRGRHDAAEAHFRAAVRLSPDDIGPLYNLAACLDELGRAAESIPIYDAVIRREPRYAQAIYNRGLAKLFVGDYPGGLADHEARWAVAAGGAPPIPGPRWDGSPLDGKDILIWCEQGLGDQVQFARFVADVARLGGKVTLAARAPLLRLLIGLEGVGVLVDVDRVFPETVRGCHCALLSLPHVLGVTTATLAASAGPYLKAEPGRVARWRVALEAETPGATRVGINWQGSTTHVRDGTRSIPLAAFAPLAAVEGVALYSLQHGHGSEQLAGLAGAFRVTDLASRLDGTFDDTAAAMAALDLVVTCDSAPAHLAGALGVEAWVALPADRDWRWMLGRDDSPWYPSLRLFRRGRAGDWRGLFARMAEALRGRLAATHGRAGR